MFGECLTAITSPYGLPGSLFMGGLVGGFTHCAGMCSPFVLAQTGSDFAVRKLGKSLLLPYHLGRMTAYVLLAVAVSSFVNLAFLFSNLKSLIAIPMLIMAALIFLVSTFPALSALFPWIGRIQIGIPLSHLRSPITKLTDIKNPLARYGLGVLLGFMPCGLVIAALMAASTAPSLPQTAIAMTAFTLGTMPALILIGFGGIAVKKKFPKATQRLSQGAMVISSLWLLALASTMIF